MTAAMLDQLEVYHKIFRPYVLDCQFMDDGTTVIRFRAYATEYVAIFDSNESLITLEEQKLSLLSKSSTLI